MKGLLELPADTTCLAEMKHPPKPTAPSYRDQVVTTTRGVAKQQCDMLMSAIESYIAWLKTHKPEVVNNHTSTWYDRSMLYLGTRKIGNVRNLLALLPEHFSQQFENNFKSHNETLDEHLKDSFLTILLDNSDLFLQWFTSSTQISSLDALQVNYSNIYDSSTNHTPFCQDRVVQLAEQYRTAAANKNNAVCNLKAATFYCALALQYGMAVGLPIHQAALSNLRHFANTYSESQYLLGLTYQSLNNVQEAIPYWICAAEQHHAKAKNRLLITPFTLEQYVLIAQKYAENTQQAQVFYEKAWSLDSSATARAVLSLEKNTHWKLPFTMLASKNPDYLYTLAQEQESASSAPSPDTALENACFLYTILIRINHTGALAEMRRLAAKGLPLANYLLAYEYYHPREDLKNAIHNCQLAAKNGHNQALYYLLNTPFKQDDYYRLAQWFEQNPDLPQNLRHAIDLYQKAKALSHLKQFADHNPPDDHSNYAKKALFQLAKTDHKLAFELGTLYEADTSCQNDKNIRTACIYYALSIEKVYQIGQGALRALQNIVQRKETHRDTLLFLGETYLKGDHGLESNIKMAKFCFERGSERGDPKAFNALASLYEKIDKDFVKAAHYYQLAHQMGYTPALKHTETLLENTELSKDDSAAIAAMYHQALVEDPHYLHLGLKFYKKAADDDHAEAALYLAEFYLQTHSDILKDKKLAFLWYLHAAKIGHCDAEAPLKRLGKQETSANQLALSNLYEHGRFFKDPVQAEYWRNLARKTAKKEKFQFTVSSSNCELHALTLQKT
jgi:TPR repeat protein